jgi:hypothetical protein
MTFMKAWWHHDSADLPVLLFSELDAERWETRSVEVFRDGRIGYASATESAGPTMLGQLPVPELDEIRADPEFDAEEITREEFEAVWERRAAGPAWPGAPRHASG